VPFFELFSRGDAPADDIDVFVGRWHDKLDPWAQGLSLSDYLGLHDDEYQVWVFDPDSLPNILAARRARQPLHTVMAERLDALVAVGQPTDATIVKGLRVWLAAHAED
jgi:hypothetical protein